jgi:hypothetical protein
MTDATHSEGALFTKNQFAHRVRYHEGGCATLSLGSDFPATCAALNAIS